MIGEKQKEFDLDSMQLLYYQAPISALMLLLPVLFCEPLSNLLGRSWSITELV
jgi:solute carrier family 35 protein E3